MFGKTVRRTFLVLSLALVIIAFVAGSAFGTIFLGSYNRGSTSTASVLLHEVFFTQEGACSPAVYAAPWAVVLNSKSTIIEPPGSILPSQNGYGAAPAFENYSVIVFALTEGTYDYSVLPSLMAQSTGTVTVNSSDVTVLVAGPTISCTTTTNVSQSGYP